MRFRATKPGFFDGSRVGVGQEFEAKKDFKSAWAIPVEKVPPDKPESRKKEGQDKKV